jgi:hypothetical protein
LARVVTSIFCPEPDIGVWGDPRLGNPSSLPTSLEVAYYAHAEAVLRDNGPGSLAQLPDSGQWLSSAAMLFSQ